MRGGGEKASRQMDAPAADVTSIEKIGKEKAEELY